jgi:hypothetical protein
MKTITQLLLLASACISTNVFSQTSVGFTAGASIASVRSNVSGTAKSTNSKVGFTAGVLANCGLSPNFSIQPALNFVQKGGKENDDKSTLNYLEVPVNVIYNTNAYYGFFIGAGPALSVGLSGKDTYTYNGRTQTDDLKFGKDKDLKRMELSANVLAGYRFPAGVQLALNYNLGLTNLITYPTSGDKATNRYIGIRLGYLISSYKKARHA